MVKAHNLKPQATSKLAINKFADISDEEWRIIKGSNSRSGEGEIPEKIDISQLDIMATNVTMDMDWSYTDFNGPVYDQGQCLGGCWAFSTVQSFGMALSILNDQTYS